MPVMSFASDATAASICDGPATASNTANKQARGHGRCAEESKRNLEAQLSGKAPVTDAQPGQTIDQAIIVFLQDKKNQEVTAKVLAKYKRELARLKNYFEGRGIFVVSGLNKELLTGYAATWREAYPASSTRSRVRDRLSTFLRYCYQAEWLPRIPKLSPVKVEQLPTMPLLPKNTSGLLDTTYATFADEPERGSAYPCADSAHAALRTLHTGRTHVEARRSHPRCDKEPASHRDLTAEDRHTRVRSDTR